MEFTDLEIKKSFEQMDPRKAPGIDGYREIFIKKIGMWVVYKIVAKVLANRLKDTLPSCISQNQNAFVLGQMIHDNVLIAHELVYYLQSAKNGPNKGFVIKLKMSKAYDRVEWNFIEEVMKRMGYAKIGWQKL
ncbi:hypothetical protein PVK06_012028 [Gossypium arboreum]|uniref:Reverse transcriptase domain-containing protein n=1 Tax=Gossypium arboreum TaxID=29729 RepID=A0ABR0QB47_GOSAR|nr:hypothetical protein PVK06_012028 [Gossypium arboreum]